MRHIAHRILVIFGYALGAVAALFAFIYVFGPFMYAVVGELGFISGFNLADHMSKDQRCMVSQPPKGCPGNP